MKFVKINGVIYDYAEYRLKTVGLLKAVSESIEEAITRYGFSKEKENVFYSRKYDI